MEERVHQVKKLFLDMGRTASLAADASSVHAAVTTEARAATDSARDDRRRVVAIARVLPLDEGTLRDAMPLSEAEGLTLPDATILACILLDASTDRPSCFLNKNKKDFGRDVANLLAPKSCRLITSFADGLAYVRSLLLPTRGSASVRSPSDPIASATTLRSPWRIWRTGRRPR